MAEYNAIRDQIKTGDMLLFRNRAGGGLRAVIERWLVEHFTASPYIHVGVALAEHGRVSIMDMTTKGCAPRPLSKCGDFDWIPAPFELSEKAVSRAFESFGELTYSRWHGVLAAFKRLTLGRSQFSECAEFALSLYLVDTIAPTNIATPSACAHGAMVVWGAPLYFVKHEAPK